VTKPLPFAVRHGLPGLVGTSLMAVGALGIGWLPLTSDLSDGPIVGLLRTTVGGSLTARAMVIIGLAVLLQAWLLLGAELHDRQVGQDQPRLRELAGVLALWSAPLLLTPPMFSRDVYSYYAQGRVYAAGYDPTTTGIDVIPGWFDDGADPMWVESPTPYGPAFLLVERTISSFAHPNAYLGMLLFRLVALCGVILLLWAVPALAAMHGVDADRAVWAGVLNPMIIMHFVCGAHNDALTVGLAAAGLLLAARRRCLWGAVAVSLAVAIKPVAIIALPFVGLLWAGREGRLPQRIRAWGLSLVVLVATVASALLLADAGKGFISAAFGTPSGVLTWLSPSTAIGKLTGMATRGLGWTIDAELPLKTVRMLGLTAAVLVVAYLVLRPGGRSPVRGAAIAFGTVVILGPVVQPWYLLWALPLFAATGLSRTWLRVVVVVTAGFTVHGMIETSTNADNITDIADVVVYVLAFAVIALVLLASSRERALILGDDGLVPSTEAERRHRADMTWPA
jgi:alpha-1,6-mannosyltransferase